MNLYRQLMKLGGAVNVRKVDRALTTLAAKVMVNATKDIQKSGKIQVDFNATFTDASGKQHALSVKKATVYFNHPWRSLWNSWMYGVSHPVTCEDVQVDGKSVCFYIE